MSQRRRRRNYKAMTEEKLFRCYWELRNGLKRAGTPRETDYGTEWDSAFGYAAYNLCVQNGSKDPWADCLYIESYCVEAGIPLLDTEDGERHNTLRKKALGKAPLAPSTPRLELIKEETTDVIVI